MNGTQQTEALRLADKYEIEGFLQDHRFAQDHWCRQAAAELRRQHARIAELEAQLAATQPAAQGPDAETQRHAAIGKAIERACMDLPDGTEISVSLEKDAATVRATQGMTLRDYFAAKAMQGYLASFDPHGDPVEFATKIAEDAYTLADTMLKAREAAPQN